MAGRSDPQDPLRIGATGHRFLAEVGKLARAVETALDRIESAFPGRRLVAVSPLAEGADRLIARAVLERRGAGLIVPLPLPVDDYRTDFATEASQAEFEALLAQASETIDLPPTATRDDAYQQVGRYVADACDVLIALWDGREPQGQGGTAEVVRRAVGRGIPVFHVKAGNRRPGTHEPTTLGPGQGRLIIHNL